MDGFDLNTLIATLAGTFVAGFAGAWAAQAVIIRRDDRREFAAEIRALNAASTLALVVAHKFIALKSQHVRGMLLNYNAERQAYAEFLKPSATEGAKVLETVLDLKTLEPPVVPIDALGLRCASVDLPPRAVAALADLQTCVAALSAALRERTRLIEEHRQTLPAKTEKQAALWYLGAADEKGIIDERFGNTLTAIGLYCDDCVFFARILNTDLATYGRQVRRAYWWRFHRAVHVQGAADWSTVKDQSLLPRESEYAGWLSGFRKRRRWWRFWAR